MCSLNVATRAHQPSGPGAAAAVQTGAGPRHRLSQPLRLRTLVRALLPASKKGRDHRWPHGRPPGGKSLNRVGKRSSCWKRQAATHGSQMKSTLTLDWAVLTRGRCHKGTDTTPICTADHRFFRPRNTLYSPSVQQWTEIFSEYEFDRELEQATEVLVVGNAER